MSNKISVVILNYNGKGFVGECVDSVLRSDYPDFEVVLVDNGSSDGSYVYLKERYKKKGRVRVFKIKKNRYFTGGLNFGAKRCRGEKIVFLSNDIVVEKTFLKEMVKFVGERKKLLVQPKILFYKERQYIDNAGGRYRFGVGDGRGGREKDEGQYDKDGKIDFAASAVFMIDKAFFEELGGYDEWFKYYYEDVDLNLRAKSKGGESWYCFRARVYHKGSLTIKKQSLSEELIFCVRRNMVWTVFNNFEGKELVFRLGLIWIFLFLMTARDFLTLKFSRVMASLRSQKAVFEKLRKTQPWIKSQV